MVCSGTAVLESLWIFFITDCHILTVVMGKFYSALFLVFLEH